MLVRLKANWFAPGNLRRPDKLRIMSGRRYRKGEYELPLEAFDVLPKSAVILDDGPDGYTGPVSKYDPETWTPVEPVEDELVEDELVEDEAKEADEDWRDTADPARAAAKSEAEARAAAEAFKAELEKEQAEKAKVVSRDTKSRKPRKRATKK